MASTQCPAPPTQCPAAAATPCPPPCGGTGEAWSLEVTCDADGDAKCDTSSPVVYGDSVLAGCAYDATKKAWVDSKTCGVPLQFACAGCPTPGKWVAAWAKGSGPAPPAPSPPGPAPSPSGTCPWQNANVQCKSKADCDTWQKQNKCPNLTNYCKDNGTCSFHQNTK
jgi:hypothetical protein